MSNAISRAFAQIVSRAWRDDDFRRRLLETPEQVFLEWGLAVPEGMRLKVVADDQTTTHFVLPMPPPDLESIDLS